MISQMSSYSVFIIFNYRNKNMKNKTIAITHKPLIVYIITALMLSTSIVYFYVAIQDYSELLQMPSANSDDMAEKMATTNEIIFFLIVGIAYIPIAIWMLKVKHNSKIPYIISIIGSAALILFYILTRTTNIPLIGLQTDVGTIDIASKIIQVGIISVSSFLMISMVKREQTEHGN